MKKALLILIVPFLMAFQTNGQVFTQEDWAASLGLGFGWYGYGYSVSSFPAISLTVEKGVWDIENVGVISLGGTVGYKYATYDWKFVNVSYDWSWSDLVVAARGALYPRFFDSDKVDLYGGMTLGARFQTYKYYASLTNNDPVEYSENNTYFLIGVFFGGRYYFTEKFAVYSELGYGLGYFTLGATYRF